VPARPGRLCDDGQSRCRGGPPGRVQQLERCEAGLNSTAICSCSARSRVPASIETSIELAVCTVPPGAWRPAPTQDAVFTAHDNEASKWVCHAHCSTVACPASTAPAAAGFDAGACLRFKRWHARPGGWVTRSGGGLGPAGPPPAETDPGLPVRPRLSWADLWRDVLSSASNCPFRAGEAASQVPPTMPCKFWRVGLWRRACMAGPPLSESTAAQLPWSVTTSAAGHGAGVVDHRLLPGQGLSAHADRLHLLHLSVHLAVVPPRHWQLRDPGTVAGTPYPGHGPDSNPLTRGVTHTSLAASATHGSRADSPALA
jgi:hypothetical protein